MKRKLVLGLVIGFLAVAVSGFAQNAWDFQLEDRPGYGRTLVKYRGTAENVIVPAGVTTIGAAAFNRVGANSRAANLRSITLPAGLTRIMDSAFVGCTNLSSITLPASLTHIADSAFSQCGLINVVLPKGIISVGSYTFGHNRELVSVILPEGLTSHTISGSAFNECPNLKMVFVPGGSAPANVFRSSVTVFDASSILQRVREDYVNNPQSADAAWKGKLIGIAGRIGSFESDGSIVVIQTVGDTEYRSLCRLHASASGNLIRYDVGSAVSIMGTVTNMGRLASGAAAVILSDCTF